MNSQEDKILRDLGNPLRESKGPPRTTSKLWNTRTGLCALNSVGVLEFDNEGILPQVACLFLCRPVCLLITSVYFAKEIGGAHAWFSFVKMERGREDTWRKCLCPL